MNIAAGESNCPSTDDAVDEAHRHSQARPQLAPEVGEGPSFLIMPGGFSFQGTQYHYDLTIDADRGRVPCLCGHLRGYGRGTHFQDWADWSMAWCRRQFALALAKENVEIARLVRRDLFQLRIRATLALACLEAREIPSEHLERGPVDLLVRGLSAPDRNAVARLAIGRGAQVFTGRSK